MVIVKNPSLAHRDSRSQPSLLSRREFARHRPPKTITTAGFGAGVSRYARFRQQCRPLDLSIDHIGLPDDHRAPARRSGGCDWRQRLLSRGELDVHRANSVRMMRSVRRTSPPRMRMRGQKRPLKVGMLARGGVVRRVQIDILRDVM